MQPAGGLRVVEVDESVRREVRVDGDAEQAAFAAGVDRQRERRRRQQLAVLHNAQGTALLRR